MIDKEMLCEVKLSQTSGVAGAVGGE